MPCFALCSASPHRRALLAALLAVAGLIGPRSASADALAAPDSRNPAIAVDPGSGLGLAVYERGGFIFARTVDAQGRVVGTGERLLFPESLASSERYRDPAIVFKQPQNRWYVAAVRQSRGTLNLGRDTTITTLYARGIEIAAFDRNLTRLYTGETRTPGQTQFPTIAEGERRPALAASGGSGDCCIGMAWRDARETSHAFFASFKLDLSGTQAPPNVFDAALPAAGYVGEVALTHDSRRSRFALAYDACVYPARSCNVVVRTIRDWDSAASDWIKLPRVDRGVPTRPSIVYVPASLSSNDRLLLAYHHVTTTTSGESPGVRIQTLRYTSVGLRESVPQSLSHVPSLGWVYSSFARRNPHAVALGDGRRAVIVAEGDGALYANRLLGFTVNIEPLRVDNARWLTGTLTAPANARVAYLPASGRALFVWEQITAEAGTWAGAFAP